MKNVAWAPVFLGFLSALGSGRCEGAPGDVHLALGNPSGAVHDPQRPNPADFLMVKDQFALSYDSRRGIPNWVSYRLRRTDMGRAPRGPFYPDPDLPRSFYAVKPFDYQFGRTGMTRGHMCPSSHRNRTEADARATFVMTNMVPQTEELNAGAWNELEIWCRDMAFDRRWEMYIVCGPLGAGGRSVKGLFKTLAGGKLVVPAACWKVVLVLDAKGRDPLARVSRKSLLFGVIMPNDRTPERSDWRDYLVPVAEVEKRTGYRFFDRVPEDVLGASKRKVPAVR